MQGKQKTKRTLNTKNNIKKRNNNNMEASDQRNLSIKLYINN